jgi:hypothetical protein
MILGILLIAGGFALAADTDINDDGKVDIEDLVTVALAFGSYEGHERWNPDADLNDDGKVDIDDVVLVAKDFGKIIEE